VRPGRLPLCGKAEACIGYSRCRNHGTDNANCSPSSIQFESNLLIHLRILRAEKLRAEEKLLKVLGGFGRVVETVDNDWNEYTDAMVAIEESCRIARDVETRNNSPRDTVHVSRSRYYLPCSL